MKNSIIFIAFTISLLLTSCLDEPEIQKNDNKGNFEALWKIIDTQYCYLDYKNINWDSIHSEYEVRINDSLTDIELFDIMGQMLAELKDGHVNLYSEFNRSRYWKWFSDYPSNFNSSILYSDRYLSDNYMIAGGMRYAKLANDSVGYIYYGDFSDRFSDNNIRLILQYFKDCKGLIFDVRNNGGGYLDLAEQLASYFFTEETLTGYMQHKTGDGHSDFSTPVKVMTPAHKTIRWKLPVVILSNRMSYSATNSFICRMKLAPNATIIGDKSGGGGGLPSSSEIPNGWMVRFSASPMYDANMQHTEWGINPDVPIGMDSLDATKGIDSIIEKAIEMLQ